MSIFGATICIILIVLCFSYITIKIIHKIAESESDQMKKIAHYLRLDEGEDEEVKTDTITKEKRNTDDIPWAERW